jgi:predicted DNA binding CopG/RHH family protein
MNQLDSEEQAIFESVETDQWHSVANLPEAIKQAQQYAKATFNQLEEVYIQLQQNDLKVIKIKALHEGIAYQALISSIVHKYLAGHLVEN